MKKIEYKYMVCTKCFTYNHSSYIIDAMKGFASQKTSFPVVFCVVDDASTDNEPELLCQWAKDELDFVSDDSFQQNTDYGQLFFAPHKTNTNAFFAIILLKENHRKQRKPKWCYLTQWLDNSKYHAICEGDDYWIDPLKLEKQVMFMESHPNYSMCFHNAKTIDMNTGETVNKFCLPKQSRRYTASDLFYKGWFAPTASMLFINMSLPLDLKKFKREHCPNAGGDIMNQLYLAHKGSFWYIADTMSVYRFGVPGSATMSAKGGGYGTYKQYLRLLSYANKTLFRYKYTLGVIYRYVRFWFGQIINR